MASLPLLSAPGSGPGGGGRPRAGTADEDASRHSLHLHHVTNPFVDRAIAMERVHQTMEEPQKVCRGDEVSFLSLFMWVLFGASGWWSSNVIFAELPLFVEKLPAAQKLGNQLSLMTQLGNIFLIAYKIIEYYFNCQPANVIHMMMAMAVLSLIGCAYLWDTVIDGRSFPLLVLMAIAGGVGCLSNATYWAFMISYPAVCTKACGVGMSLGGVLTTWLAASQLAGRRPNSPRFTARSYFLIAALMQCVLWLVIMVQEGSLAATCLCIRRWWWRRAATNGQHSEHLLANGSPVRLTRVNSDASDAAARTPLALGSLFSCSFFVQAFTYTVPSLLPFVASACNEHGSEQQILLWMLVCQQAGETAGRLVAPISRAWSPVPAIAALYFLIVFAILFTVAADPDVLIAVMSCSTATVALPTMCFGYFCSFGVMQTFIFLSARRCVKDKAEKEIVASDMGFLGQMGSLSANLVAFAVLSLD